MPFLPKRTFTSFPPLHLDPATRTSQYLRSSPFPGPTSQKDNCIKIVEVGPRDGLQNLGGKVVKTDLKLQLVQRLLEVGVKNVEVGSFVRGDLVPQMADTAQLLPLLPDFTSKSHSITATSRPYHTDSVGGDDNGVHYPVLIPNMRGLDDLLKLEGDRRGKGEGNVTDEIAVFVSATEAFSEANSHASPSTVLSSLPSLISKAHEHGLRVRGYVSCVITDPYTHAYTPPEEVVDVVERLMNMGCYEVSLGDTTGEGDPGRWGRLWGRLGKRGVDLGRVAVHCHDTYALALPTILSLLPLGLRTIDTSLSGLGGCPFAPGATGNVATEDVVYALEKMGYHTGIDLEGLVSVGRWWCGVLGVNGESRVGRAWRVRGDVGGETEDGM